MQSIDHQIEPYSISEQPEMKRDGQPPQNISFSDTDFSPSS